MDFNEKPLVSVIVPCRNSVTTIGRTIDSVLAQCWPNELLVVDNGSSDGTPEFVQQRYGAAVKLLVEPRSGGSRARNAGMASAIGEWFLFLDSDDWIDSDYLQRASHGLCLPSADLIFSEAILYRPGESVRLDLRAYGVDRESILDAIVDYQFVQCPGQVLIRRSLLDCIGGWNSELPRLQDYFFVIRAVLNSKNILYNSARCHKDDFPRLGRVSRDRNLESEIRLACIAANELRYLSEKISIEIYMKILNKLYGSACNFYAAGDFVAGDRLLKPLQQVPHFTHQGNFLHRLLCAMIGIRGRYVVSRALNATASNLQRFWKRRVLRSL